MEGLPVLLTGCGNEAATSGPNGQVQFLSDDAIPTVTITINGAPAWTGPSAELRGTEVFQKSGASFVRK